MTDSEQEIWKEIKGYEGKYQISNLGRVRSYKNGKEVILKGYIQNTGYLTVALNNQKFSVHRLVANAFIHKLDGKDFVNHKDGNKLNNNIDNLEWCTNRENIIHAWKSGLMKNSGKINSIIKPRAKIIKQYDLNGNYIKSFKGSKEAELELKSKGIKVNARNIRNVCECKRNKAGGFKWKYESESTK